jgi:hypothetical protein
MHHAIMHSCTINLQELLFSLLLSADYGAGAGGGNLGNVRSEQSKLNLLLAAVSRFPGTAILHATVPQVSR